MAMNPIGLIVAAVAGLVAAFVVLWNKCDAFREFWINLWEGIKKAFGAVVDWVKDNWQSMLLALVNPLAGVFKYCYDNFEGFRETVDNVVSAVGKFFKDLWSGIVNWADEAWTDIKNGVAAVGKFFVDLWSGFKQGAANAWSATKETFSKVGSFFKDTFTKAWTAVKNVFSAGGKIFDGIKDGIANAFKSVVNAIIRGINKVVATPFNAINAMLDKIRNVSIAGISPFKNLIYRFAVPEIPQLATGGVVRKATTAVIGEDGAEAVVPLEKNTGWIKKLAGEIAAQQPKSVVVNQTNNYAQAHSRLELYKTKQNTAAAVRLALSGTGA
jgi:phage-related protein